MEQLLELLKNIDNIYSNINTIEDLNKLKVEYMWKKWKITELNSLIRTLPNDEKKEFGKKMNELKQAFTSRYDSLKEKLEEELINQKLSSEKIDISLPATKINIGSANILEKLIEEVEELLISMGYDVVDGPELEQDKYNFELLNIPKGHPVRDAQDTFYIKDEELLLRSQTSPVQIRVMLANKEKKPIRMICPGKTYRRDDDDATHSHQFTQIEGLLVDHDVSLSDLKGTIDEIIKKLFGNDVKTRFRPSYYPFTEPSVEVDISCFNCQQKGCSICKNTGWITVAGGGIVHPNVLNNCGYQSSQWTGFAFGFGAERLAMLKYGINDVRTFYTTNLKELETFDRIEK